MTFAEQVVFVRVKLNISQESMAKKLNVSFATVNRWELGKTSPTRKTIIVFEQFCRENGIVFSNTVFPKESLEK